MEGCRTQGWRKGWPAQLLQWPEKAEYVTMNVRQKWQTREGGAHCTLCSLDIELFIFFLRQGDFEHIYTSQF